MNPIQKNISLKFFRIKQPWVVIVVTRNPATKRAIADEAIAQPHQALPNVGLVRPRRAVVGRSVHRQVHQVVRTHQVRQAVIRSVGQVLVRVHHVLPVQVHHVLQVQVLRSVGRPVLRSVGLVPRQAVGLVPRRANVQVRRRVRPAVGKSVKVLAHPVINADQAHRHRIVGPRHHRDVILVINANMDTRAHSSAENMGTNVLSGKQEQK